jgi:hypothetical protein
MVVLHYTAMETPRAALDRLCDPVPEVSAHYLIAEMGEVYEFIEPTAVPERVDDGAPNIVTFALQSTNALGQSIYRRSGNTTAEGLARNCARYGSSDLAQEAFLASGGPERDPKRLDPDGDGFACYWDPTPFRNIAAN